MTNLQKKMEKLMADFGVQVDENLKEPADHLAVELDFWAT